MGFFLVILSALAFGFMALFRSWAGEAGVESVLALRFAIGGAILWAIVLARRLPMPPGRWVLALIAMGAGCYFGEAYCYFAAIRAGAPSGLVALLLYTFPGLVALGSWLLFRQRISAVQWVALVVALTGAAMTAWPIGSAPLLGLLLGAACSVIYAVYILAGSRLPSNLSPLVSSAIVTTSAAGSFVIAAMLSASPLPATPLGWAGVAALGVLSTAVAITALLAGIARIGAVRASTISVLEPLTTVIVGVLALGEPMSGLKALGGVLIVAAAVASSLSGRPGRD